MGTEQNFLNELDLSRLNAAHYKALLSAANFAAKERELLDLRRAHEENIKERSALVANVGGAVGRKITTWDTSTGAVEYEPLPPVVKPPSVVKPRHPVVETPCADPEPVDPGR